MEEAESPGRPRLTVAEVCVFTGPGYGECWGCPVVECPLWSDPTNPFSQETLNTALKAVTRLHENRTVIEGVGGRSVVESAGSLVEAARDLVLNVVTPAFGRNIRIQMAAEAVVQGRLAGRISTHEERLIHDAQRTAGVRELSQAEVDRLGKRLDNLATDVAASVYHISDRDALEAAIAHLRGLEMRPTALYRKERGR